MCCAVEVESLIEMLPNVVMTIREDKYEHLDTMWADSARLTVFPRVRRESACVWLAFVEKAFVRTGVVEVWEWLRFGILGFLFGIYMFREPAPVE